MTTRSEALEALDEIDTLLGATDFDGWLYHVNQLRAFITPVPDKDIHTVDTPPSVRLEPQPVCFMDPNSLDWILSAPTNGPFGMKESRTASIHNNKFRGYVPLYAAPPGES